MKKLYWIIFAVVAAGVTAGLLYIINKPTPAVAPVVVKPITQKQSTTTSSSAATSSPTDMSGWQVYTSRQFGFSFYFPTLGTQMEESEGSEGGSPVLNFAYYSNADKQYYDAFNIFVQKNADNLSAEQWFENNVDDNGILLKNGSFEFNNLVGGGGMYELVTGLPSTFIQNDGPVSQAYIMSPDQKYVFIFDLSQDGGYQVQGDIFKILSTFKFTN